MSYFEFDFDNKLIRIEDRGIRNGNLIQFFKNYPVIYSEALEGITLMVGKSDKPWVYIDYEPIEVVPKFKNDDALLTQKYKKPLAILISKLPQEYCHFAVVEKWMEPLIVKQRLMYDVLRCKKLYKPKMDIANIERVLGQYAQNTAFESVDLCLEDAAFIQANHKYAEFTDEVYIEDRIKRGLHAGIRKNGELIAWVITHDDGAIGFLFVFDAYRGLGLADWLTQMMLLRHYEHQMIPFIHVEETNVASLSLAKKTGFLEAFDVTWFSLK